MINMFKTKTLLLAFAVISIGAHAQDKPKPVTIKGTFADAPSSKVILGYHQDGKSYLKDSTYSDANGRFTFSYNELLPQGQYLLLFPEKENKYTDIFLGSDQQFTISANLSDIEATVVITGSEDNEVYFTHLKQIAALRKETDVLKKRKEAFMTLENLDSAVAVQKRIEGMDKRYYKLRDELLTRPKNAFTDIVSFQWRPEIPESMTDQSDIFLYYKAHYFDKANWSSAAVMRSTTLIPFISEYIDNLTVQSPDSIIEACDLLLQKASVSDELFQQCLIALTNKYANTQNVCFDKIYVHLVDAYYSSGRAFWMTGENLAQLEQMQKSADRLRPFLCGSSAYNLNLKQANGTQTELRKISGKHTLLVFYHDSKPYDVELMKALSALRPLLEKKGVSVVAVSMHYELEPAAMQQTVKDLGIAWCTNLQVANDQELTLIKNKFGWMYGYKVFVLDEQKKIVYKDLDAGSTEQVVNSFPDKP